MATLKDMFVKGVEVFCQTYQKSNRPIMCQESTKGNKGE